MSQKPKVCGVLFISTFFVDFFKQKVKSKNLFNSCENSRCALFCNTKTRQIWSTFKLFWACLDSWVVSHLVVNISTWHHPLGSEFEPWWWQTLFRTQAQHLCFLHDSIWFIWIDTIICLSNLSHELWNRKLNINKIYFSNKTFKMFSWQLEGI